MIPFSILLIAYIVMYLVSSLADLILEGINVNHVNKWGKEVPETFKGFVEEPELSKMSQYTLDNTRFSMVHGGTSKLIFLFIILSGILPWLADTLQQMNYIWGGLIYFAVPGFIMVLSSLPFDYYESFVIEQRYGFNTKTLKTWISDLVKGTLLSIILGSILLAALLLIVRYGGRIWWAWAWAIFLAFEVLMPFLYPAVIAPLFNKFTPFEDSPLADKIRAIARKEDLTLKGMYQMDATKRTKHTNAYFTGLGAAKRVVLFDSLIASHTDDEILSVLAHEIGHLKKNHIKKQLFIMGAFSALLFYLASRMLSWELMYQAFGYNIKPEYVGLFLVGVLWGPIGFFLSPLWMAISRKYEREADQYCMKSLNNPMAFSTALKKMAKDNLSNLCPHPIYVWFNYSHPPLLERIRRIEAYSGSRV